MVSKAFAMSRSHIESQSERQSGSGGVDREEGGVGGTRGNELWFLFIVLDPPPPGELMMPTPTHSREMTRSVTRPMA
jgi:hypothetical protein